MVFISTCTEDLPPCDLRPLVLPHSFYEYFPQTRRDGNLTLYHTD